MMFCPFRTKNINDGCQGPECMWFIKKQDKCAITVLAEKETPKNIRVNVKEEYDGRDL
jgi:hypothetical protein